jgi:hypothetical protein
MSGEKRKPVCTIDHANKQSDAQGFNPYEYWLKQARRLKAAKKRQPAENFRRDMVDADKT